MKTPQEYVELFAESLDWEVLIPMIQKEAWNEAVDACADKCETELTSTCIRVNKQSILKNKI